MDVRPLHDQARKAFEEGRFKEAESTLELILEVNPRDSQALSALGLVLGESGQLQPAIQHFKRALEAGSPSAWTLCWLSHYLMLDGQIEAAQQHAEQALAMDPRSPMPSATLARCLVRRGMNAEAIPHFQRTLALDPNGAALWIELADALQACNLWSQVVEALRKAVLLAPNERGLARLADMELRFGKVAEAERYCRRLLRRAPESAEAHLLMGRILTEKELIEEAEGEWSRAAELGADPSQVHLERAVSLRTVGQFDRAAEELLRSIELAPLHGEAYQALAYGKRMGADDAPLIRQMESLLERGLPTPDDRLNMLYALGKSYDDIGEYDRAIQYFDEANALRKKVFAIRPFDRAAFSAVIDAKIALFDPKFFRDPRHYRSQSTLPLLVVGMMRSGTTLAEQMLSRHSKVGAAGEQSYWANNEMTMIDLPRGAVNAARVITCAKEYLQLLASTAPGFPHVTDKNPANLQYLGSFHLAFPGARIVCTRRNAIDTALSIWMTPMHTSAEFVCDRENIVFAYREYMRLLDHWRKVIPDDRLCEVRYEDLVSEPAVHGRRMVEFCGLPWEEACLHPEQNDRLVRTPSLWQVRQPIYKTSTERWRRYEPWLGAFAELSGQ